MERLKANERPTSTTNKLHTHNDDRPELLPAYERDRRKHRFAPGQRKQKPLLFVCVIHGTPCIFSSDARCNRACRFTLPLPAFRSMFTTSPWPPAAAPMRAVMPSLRLLFADAPLFNNSFSTSFRPSPEASQRAVTPDLASASTSAPA